MIKFSQKPDKQKEESIKLKMVEAEKMMKEEVKNKKAEEAQRQHEEEEILQKEIEEKLGGPFVDSGIDAIDWAMVWKKREQ